MPISPFIFNIAFIASFLKDYKGAVRNLIFIVLFLVVSQIFGNYLFEQTIFYSSDSRTESNYLFGVFLLCVLVIDVISFIIKYRSLQFQAYEHKKYIDKDSSCISAIESIFIGLSMFFNFLPTALVISVVINSLQLGAFLLGISILLVFAKWFYVFMQCRLLTPKQITNPNTPSAKGPSTILQKINNALITISSTVIYIVVWRVTVYQIIGDYKNIFAFDKLGNTIEITVTLFFASIALYLPSRLLFILEDYYTLTDLKRKRAAFLTSVLAILVPIVAAVIDTI